MRSNRAGILLGLVVGIAVAGHASAQPQARPSADGLQRPKGMGTSRDAPVAREPTPEQQGYRSELERAWFRAEGGSSARAARLRTTTLALGVDNLDPAARALIVSADPGNALANAMLAVRLAPDLPIAHMALARAKWEEGDRSGALQRAASGVMAILSNFEAAAWLVGSLLVMLAAVMVVAPLFFIASVGASLFGLACHDLGDLLARRMPDVARAALLGTALLAPLALGEGIVGLALALFALGFTYGGSRHRMALVLAVALFVLGLYPVARSAGMALLALDSDPVVAATLAVVQGVESRADTDLLERASETEFLAQHVLAVRARRLGRLDEAVDRYSALLESHPQDPYLLTNLGNLRFMAGDREGAVDLYERSAGQIDSARGLFNLSQAYAGMFRIEEFEATLRAAQRVDNQVVADLSRVGEADFVADLAFPLSSLRSRLFVAARERDTGQTAIDFLMPGWLGRSWMHVAGSFGLVAVLAAMLAFGFVQASHCTRCGRRICSRCDDTVWNSETCDGCHHLFHRPETTDPVLRMKRLCELQERDTRIGRVVFVASLLVPGAGGLLARRPDLGFLAILACGFAVVFLVWHEGVVPDPLAVGSAGSLAFLAAGCTALFAYLSIVVAGLMIRRNL